MRIDEILKKGYEWAAHLTAELVKELRKDKAEILSNLSKEYDELKKELQTGNKLSDEIATSLEIAIKELRDKSVSISNPNEIKDDIVSGLENVVVALKEEVKKLDKDIIINTDLEPLLEAFKKDGKETKSDNASILYALKSILDKIPVVKEREIIDYTLILDDIATALENLNSKEISIDLSKIEKHLADIHGIIGDIKFEFPERLIKDDRVKIEISEKQLAKMGSSIAVQSGSASGYIKNVSGAQINPATEESLQTVATNTAALAMSVENALSATTYNLNTAAYSATTAITSDYILDSIALDFSTTQSKTITITTAQGTKLYEDTNTTQNLVISFNQSFNASENITVAVTQTAGTCTMDLRLKITKGSNTLLGNPSVYLLGADGTQIHGKDRSLFTIDYRDAVAHDSIPNHRIVYALGYSTGITQAIYDISETGQAIIPLPTTAQTITIVSTSANDTLAGTGTQKVMVDGLDGNYNEISEIVNMNGTTNVTTTNQFIRINDFHSYQVGSGGAAAGDITAKWSTNTLKIIIAGGNRDLTCVYTIPNNRLGMLLGWSCKSATGKDVRFNLRATCDTDGNYLSGVFLFQDIDLNGSGYLPTQRFRYPAKTDIKISGSKLAAGTAEGTAQLDLIIEE